MELLGATTVVKDMTLNAAHTTLGGDVSVMGKFTVNAGTATDAGSLTISGNVTAQEMNISVSAGEDVGNAYNNALVNVTGNLSVGESGKISIGGTAEQHYLGVVTAGELTVNTQAHDVYFDHIHVGSLSVGEGATVHVQTSSAASSLSTSTFPVVNLSDTLALDAHGATYNRGYEVHVQSDSAALFFGSGCTIDNLNIIGKQDESGYTNVDIEVQSRSATVTKMQDLGNLKVALGSLTAKNAEGAVHGELLLDNGKLKLGEGSDNLMASDSGALRLENGARLDIGTTTQNLSAGNEVFLSGASAVTGSAEGAGLLLADGARINYADAGNAIEANMSPVNSLILNSSESGSSLEISGVISGSGELVLSGTGTVALSGVNTFDGLVTVQQGATLTLQNTEVLLHAGVTLNDGSTLALDAPGAVDIGSLTLHNGASLSISSIAGTDDYSAQNAVLNAVQGITLGSGEVVLNVIFADRLETMTSYNIMTGLSSIDNLSLQVQHNGKALDDSQYKVGFDSATGLLYLHTLMGNVWEGNGSGKYGDIWSTSNKDGNWSDGSNYDENAEYKAAIFGDLASGAGSTVTVDGVVNPGDVYFVADTTDYVLYGDGALAAGTNIHMDGAASVQLQLYNNMEADSALGNVEMKSGRLELYEAYAVGGTVTVAEDAQLVVIGGDSFGIPIELKMGAEADGSFSYTVSGVELEDDYLAQTHSNAELSGVTLDANGICGKPDAYGTVYHAHINGDADISYLTILNSEVTGGTLSNVSLSSTNAATELMKGYYRLQDVTFGENVVVEQNSNYSITGNITFEETLVNRGKIFFTKVTAEIGQLDYSFTIDENGKSEYVYQFIRSEDGGTFDVHSYQYFNKGQVLINGVNLATGLADGVIADFELNKANGSVTVSIGDVGADGKSDGTVGMP